jgi:hypothetical protein
MKDRENPHAGAFEEGEETDGEEVRLKIRRGGEAESESERNERARGRAAQDQ